MLFLVGLMGLTAVGASMILGGEDDDMMMPEDSNSDAGEPTEDEITDIGSLIPDEMAATQDGMEQTEAGLTDQPEPSALHDAHSAQTEATLSTDSLAVDATGDGLPGPDTTDPATLGSAANESLAGQTAQDETTEERPDPAGEPWTIQTGGDSNDPIEGGDGNEFILGYAGDDVINGNGGIDQIEGGEGNDTLSGGADDDELHGDAGNDFLKGDQGNDQLFGHFGDDLLQGGQGADSLLGGQGEDTLEGGEGDDALSGYHGDDVLYGGAGEDTLFGGLGDDELHGLSPTGEDDGTVDYLNGGQGDDIITAGAGDIVTGGEGADVIQFGDWTAQDDAIEVVDYQAGEDSLVLMYEAGTAAPEVDVQPDSEDQDLYRVWADGELVATVYSATPVTSSSISLLAQTAV